MGVGSWVGVFAIFWSFFRCSHLLWKRLNSAIFRSFFRCPPPPGNFSADALDWFITNSFLSLSVLSMYDVEALIAQLKNCLLDCFD